MKKHKANQWTITQSDVKSKNGMLASLTPFLIISCMALMLSGCCEEGIRTEVETLEKEEWIGFLETVFDGVSLRLNNFTPVQHEYSNEDVDAFFMPEDSYLHIPLLDMDVLLNIPIHRQNPYSFYITDVNSVSFQPDASRGKALVRIHFADTGRKLYGNCVDNVACLGGDINIELNSMTMDIWLDIGTRGGRLVITDVEAEITSTFEETGPCVDNVFAFLCDWIAPDRENQIKSAVENQVVSHFNSYKGIIEALFNDYLRSEDITGTIKAATIAGNGNLILTVDYEDLSVTCS